MDILAHTLWAGAAMALVRRRWPLRELRARTVALTMTLAALPDVFHLLPIVAWWLAGDGTFETVRAYAIALPGSEPTLPNIVNLLSHQLHCIAHSAIVAAVVTLLLWAALRSMWVPLFGWWSHIGIDVFTHSADFYPAPVLYPITQRGFDSIAWNTPWFMALNYVALGAIGLWLLVFARSRQTRRTPSTERSQTDAKDPNCSRGSNAHRTEA